MTSKSNKASLSWSDVKARIADVNRAGLVALVHDLYAASKDNQVCRVDGVLLRAGVGFQQRRRPAG
jgi:hypothetical protein